MKRIMDPRSTITTNTELVNLASLFTVELSNVDVKVN
jgi:hypothetical protein